MPARAAAKKIVEKRPPSRRPPNNEACAGSPQAESDESIRPRPARRARRQARDGGCDQPVVEMYSGSSWVRRSKARKS